MAHLIDMTNGRANMAYVGETPWHGLGSELSRGASIDQWRVEAGLNWEAMRNALYYRDATQTVRKCESQIIYRSDTGGQLGIVSESYKIVQPSDVLEFFRDVVGTGGLELETAGSLDDGKKVWAMAKTGNQFSIKGQDTVKGYLLLSTSFDGSQATRAEFTSVRVVCNNTLRIAQTKGNNSGLVKIPHSSTFDARGTKIELGLINGAWDEFEQQANALADRKLSNKEAMNLLFEIMEPKLAAQLAAGEKVELSTMRRNQITSVFELFQGRGMGSQLVAASGTAWGMVNAVTQFVDHEVTARGDAVNNRFRSAQFGPGAALKSQAFATALALVA